MAYESFRDWINALDRAGELVRIAQPVATELEITELADRQMKSPGGGKALADREAHRQRRNQPLSGRHQHAGFLETHGPEPRRRIRGRRRRRTGRAHESQTADPFQEAIKLLGTALDLRHAKPKSVKNGPCKEVIHKFDAPSSRTEPWPRPSPDDWSGRSRRVDQSSVIGIRSAPTLLNLPIQKCWPLDGGRFITLPCVVTKDPDTGERNVGMYRIQIYDDKTTGMHWQLQKVGARHGRRYYETGTRMPVSIFLGGDPVFTFAATAPLPDGLG